MLIKCPECDHSISDKALSCPSCGCPRAFFKAEATNSTLNVEKALKSPNKRRKFKRLPNGYGYIQVLDKEKRRNPYIAYAPLTKADYNEEGKPKARERLGAFPTYNKAYECLAHWHVTHGVSTDGSPSFYQVWEKAFASKEISSKNTVGAYLSAIKKFEPIFNMPINKVYAEQMESIINEYSPVLSKPSITNMKKCCSLIFKYALKNNYVDADYSKMLDVKAGGDTEKGVPFSTKDIDILWAHSTDEDAQIVLILIYTGMRISELWTAEIDLTNKVFVGGLKTKAGKNRTIPISELIIDFVKDFQSDKYGVSNWRKRKFYPLLERLGISEGNGAKHTPHDCRHTFSWLADKYNMDDISKHLIMGHSLGGDVEKNVYSHRTLEELRYEINKIKHW